ncbi:MAG TPA: heavy metal-associated domain-containing protein, partial [Acidimicrobiia bacterium]|nr:heavy metal-associated domain-containing protein [Acidimicrobiia bacterium]
MAETQSITFDVEGMTCASCALRIERVLGKQDGVETAIVNYAGHEARAQVAPGVDVEALKAAVAKIGYEIEPVVAGQDRVNVTERYDEEAVY